MVYGYLTRAWAISLLGQVFAGAAIFEVFNHFGPGHFPGFHRVALPRRPSSRRRRCWLAGTSSAGPASCVPHSSRRSLSIGCSRLCSPSAGSSNTSRPAGSCCSSRASGAVLLRHRRALAQPAADLHRPRLQRDHVPRVLDALHPAGLARPARASPAPGFACASRIASHLPRNCPRRGRTRWSG